MNAISLSSAAQLSLFDSRQAREAFAVRVSVRARRMTVRVHVGGAVEVVVPPGATAGTVRAFVKRNTSWIERKVAELGRGPSVAACTPETVDFAATRERFGVYLRLEEPSGVHEHAGSLIVRAPDDAGACSALRDWLLGAARARLVPAVDGLAQQLGWKLSGVSIRRQRTRWGSCSSRRRLSLNCCLLFMPPEVVRYLFIHELAHLTHMNHSDRFWKVVEKHEPAYRDLDRQLTAGWRSVPGWVFKA